MEQRPSVPIGAMDSCSVYIHRATAQETLYAFEKQDQGPLSKCGDLNTINCQVLSSVYPPRSPRACVAC